MHSQSHTSVMLVNVSNSFCLLLIWYIIGYVYNLSFFLSILHLAFENPLTHVKQLRMISLNNLILNPKQTYFPYPKRDTYIYLYIYTYPLKIQPPLFSHQLLQVPLLNYSDHHSLLPSLHLSTLMRLKKESNCCHQKPVLDANHLICSDLILQMHFN